MRNLGFIILAGLSLLLMMSCERQDQATFGNSPTPSETFSSQSATGSHGMVVSISAPASDIGIAILRQGGNAVDAAIATAFALAVAYPAGGNIGGGGFMLIHPGAGDPVVIDYRETAPASATPTMFAKSDTMYEPKAVATPGTIRGMEMAHRRFGTLPWSQLVLPAVVLAREGFLVDANFAQLLNTYLSNEPKFPEFQRVFSHPGLRPWVVGDRLVQPDLARTLQRIADGGADAFYAGPIAEGIAQEMKRGNGLITAADLAGYRAIERPPQSTRYRGRYDVYTAPAPSAGGVCLIEELNILESFDLQSWGRWSPTTMHVLAEAMRRANYDRARWLGDPAFAPVPPQVATRLYGQQLAATIDLAKATRSRDLSTDIALPAEGQDTTHFSVIDAKGMAVSNTYTVERLWGTRIVVKDMGFILNNDMFGFNLFPGHTDTAGKIGTAPNTIAPGKRPISSMAPTIVAEQGRVLLITGSPGSQSIPHTILCILINYLDFHMPINQAVEAPRLSQEWFPDHIVFEAPDLFPELVASLKSLGHALIRTGPRPQGDAHTILVERPDRIIGVADHRRSDKASAVGY